MKYLGWAVIFACGAAQADGARVGIEYEREKDNRSGISNNSITVKPGWEFAKGSPINLIELLIDRNGYTSAADDGFRGRETKLFVRLRHSGGLNDRVGQYIRGGVGRSFNNQRDFNYAYVEPGLKIELSEHWEWTLAWRESDSISGTAGQRVRKLIAGPSYSFDKYNEIELRYAKGGRDKDFGAWSIGYLRKF